MSQRDGTKLLTFNEQKEVRRLLGLPRHQNDPAPVQQGDDPDAWLKSHTTPQAQEAFAKAVREKVADHLAAKRPVIEAKRKAPVLDLRSLLGAAEAAKAVVKEFYADWISRAALRPSLLAVRNSFSFSVSGNAPTIVSMTDMATRKAVGRPHVPRNVVDYLMGVGEIRTLLAAHQFHVQNGTQAEGDFYTKLVVDPIVTDHAADISLYEQYLMSMSDPTTARLFLTPEVEGWLQTDSEQKSAAVWTKKWNIFTLLVHEYLHVLEHPLLPVSTARSQIVREGFCEYLAVKATQWVGSLSQSRLEDLNIQITGSNTYPVSRSWLATTKPVDDYQVPVEKTTEAIRTVGENAVLSAFFQGHTELLGRSNGALGDDEFTWISPATEWSDGARGVPLPLSRTEWKPEWLVGATGIDAAMLSKLNPKLDLTEEIYLSEGLNLQLWLPKFRAHRVITDQDAARSETAVESWQQIADQNGVPLDKLLAANGATSTRKPPTTEELAGQWVLIPEK